MSTWGHFTPFDSPSLRFFPFLSHIPPEETQTYSDLIMPDGEAYNVGNLDVNPSLVPGQSVLFAEFSSVSSEHHSQVPRVGDLGCFLIYARWTVGAGWWKPSRE